MPDNAISAVLYIAPFAKLSKTTRDSEQSPNRINAPASYIIYVINVLNVRKASIGLKFDCIRAEPRPACVSIRTVFVLWCPFGVAVSYANGKVRTSATMFGGYTFNLC